MAEKEAHITVHDLTMAYGSFVVMRDLNFTINRGDIFIIMGGSGCGKSTRFFMVKSTSGRRILTTGTNS
jgi:phospholipid/cholesterol/gamma-HCH transport system ATP-binding protein